MSFKKLRTLQVNWMHPRKRPVLAVCREPANARSKPHCLFTGCSGFIHKRTSETSQVSRVHSWKLANSSAHRAWAQVLQLYNNYYKYIHYAQNVGLYINERKFASEPRIFMYIEMADSGEPVAGTRLLLVFILRNDRILRYSQRPPKSVECIRTFHGKSENCATHKSLSAICIYKLALFWKAMYHQLKHILSN